MLDFLPPFVDCDPETGLGLVNRAVVILMEGRDEKVGQRYTEPLLTLTRRRVRFDSIRDFARADRGGNAMGSRCRRSFGWSEG